MARLVLAATAAPLLSPHSGAPSPRPASAGTSAPAGRGWRSTALAGITIVATVTASTRRSHATTSPLLTIRVTPTLASPMGTPFSLALASTARSCSRGARPRRTGSAGNGRRRAPGRERSRGSSDRPVATWRTCLYLYAFGRIRERAVVDVIAAALGAAERQAHAVLSGERPEPLHLRPAEETAASCMRSAGSAPSMIGIITYASRAPWGATASSATTAAVHRSRASSRSALAAGSNFRGLNEQAATRTGANTHTPIRARPPSDQARRRPGAGPDGRPPGAGTRGWGKPTVLQTADPARINCK